MFPANYFKGRSKSSLSIVCAALLLAMLCAVALPGLRRAGAQTTDPVDRAFGNNGTATFPSNPTFTGGQAFQATVLRPDGKIVSVGIAQKSSSNFTFALIAARHNENGTLDTTFGTDGLSTETAVASTGASLNVFDAVLQPDKKIVVTAIAGTVTYVVRLNADGCLDTGFANGGFIKLIDDAVFFGVAIQPDGKILGSGVQFTNGASTPVLARFKADGSPDTDFGINGRVGVNFITNTGYNRSVARPDGKILVAGEFTGGGAAGERGYIVTRFNANGTPDTTFDADGTLVIPIVQNRSPRATRLGLVVQPDGKFVLAYGYNGFQDLFVRRFNVTAASNQLKSHGAPTSAEQCGRIKEQPLRKLCRRAKRDDVDPAALLYAETCKSSWP